MKQVIQNYKTARLEVKNVPAPLLRRDGLLVRSYTSLISVGTERTKIESARMSLIEKAISRLDLVKIVMANVKQEG
ncbi:MAG: oxidoreductase, partial [Candidatus Omnitrophota bacterium]